jgi:hypothetical protein
MLKIIPTSLAGMAREIGSLRKQPGVISINMNNQPVLPNIDTAYMVDFLTKLLDTPSPTGFASAAIELVEQEAAKYPEVKLERPKRIPSADPAC